MGEIRSGTQGIEALLVAPDCPKTNRFRVKNMPAGWFMR
jgi:hypothetical protein